MINTDKEERRREAGLFNKLGYIDFDVADNLLAEVKRLREGIKSLAENIHADIRGKYIIDALMELVE